MPKKKDKPRTCVMLPMAIQHGLCMYYIKRDVICMLLQAGIRPFDHNGKEITNA